MSSRRGALVGVVNSRARCRCVAEPLEERRLLAEANLVLAQLDVQAGPYDVGDNLDATAYIRNAGDWPAGPFTVRFQLVHDSSGDRFTIGDRVVTGLVQGLPPLQVLMPNYRLPATAAHADYHVRVHVDVNNDVPESNGEDNVGESIVFKVRRPDLEVTDVPRDQGAFAPGNILHSVVTVENKGAASTLASGLSFKVQYWLGDDDENDIRHIGTGDIAWLPGGASRTDGINWVVPQDAEPGTFRLCVLADSGRDVPESSEGNNWRCSESFEIVQPELEVVSVTGVEPFYKTGHLLSATATIRNNGQPTASAFQLKYYLGTDSDRTKYELTAGSIAILGGGGASREDSFPGKLITSAYEPGLYRVWVHADSGDAIPELDETDNWKASAPLRIISIDELRWENAAGTELTGAVDEGTRVFISFKGEGLDTGSSIPVDILEDDTLDNDAEREGLRVRYDPARDLWRAPWWPAWVKDAAGTDPEFYFRIPKELFGFALHFSSGILPVDRRTDDFGFEISHHSVGSGVPLVLVHGNNSDTAGNLYRWQWFEDHIRNNPADFAEFDVYVWKHDTSKPIGFNGASDSQAAGLANYIYNNLRVGVPGTQYAGQRVALLAHSQGGLVSRAFMNHDNQGDDVSGLITLGTPHHGSPLSVVDWVAAVWKATGGKEEDFLLIRSKLVDRDGTVNLAWDNLDEAVGAERYTTQFSVKPYDLTRGDINAPGASADDRTPDYYPVSLKDAYGTLKALNTRESFYHKLVAIGAYDRSLADNAGKAAMFADVAAGKLGLDWSEEHRQLGMVTRMLGEMSASGAGNDNGSPYYANDGLVPLQSALFLDIKPTSGEVAAFSSLTGDEIGIDASLIAARTPRDMKTYIAADNVQDHQDILDSTSSVYWQRIVDELRFLLDAALPTAALQAAGNGEPIGRNVLNRRGYIDVTYHDTGGSGLDPRSILDAAPEFVLSDPAAEGVTITGVERQAGDTYRYYFDGQFAHGQVRLRLIPGAFGDDAGNPNADAELVFVTVIDGDANLDGRINADDYFRIDQGFLSQPANPAFSQGDFNYDDRINADDYFLIDQAFLGQGAPPAGDAIVVNTTMASAVSMSAELEKEVVRKRAVRSLFSDEPVAATRTARRTAAARRR